MTVDNAGKIHLGYNSSDGLKVAARPSDGSVPWSFGVVDWDAYTYWPGSIRVGTDGLPGVSYASESNATLEWVGLRFARKNPEP